MRIQAVRTRLFDLVDTFAPGTGDSLRDPFLAAQGGGRITGAETQAGIMERAVKVTRAAGRARLRIPGSEKDAADEC